MVGSLIFSNTNNAFLKNKADTEKYTLTSIDIPAYIRTIGYDAFNDCNDVTNINIPGNSVQTIHSKAFMNTNISKIYIPECVKTTGLQRWDNII